MLIDCACEKLAEGMWAEVRGASAAGAEHTDTTARAPSSALLLTGAGAEGKSPPASGATITTGVGQPGVTASPNEAPACSTALATAATLAQGILPARCPDGAGTSSNAADNPDASADRLGASEPPSMFPAASLRLPSAELHCAAGLSGGGNGLSAMEPPLSTMTHGAAVAAAADGGTQHAGGAAGNASIGESSKQHAAAARVPRHGVSDSAKDPPASPVPLARPWPAPQ